MNIIGYYSPHYHKNPDNSFCASNLTNPLSIKENKEYGFGVHDGSFVFLEDGNLINCVEGEKDSHPRTALLSTKEFLRLSDERKADVLAITYQGAYLGTDPSYRGCGKLNTNTKIFFSSHERSHILSSYGMSPYPQGQPCYALCWEGTIGKFYYIDENLNIKDFPEVLTKPGYIYVIPFAISIAEEREDLEYPFFHSDPGKVMALAGFGKNSSKWESLAEKFINYKPPMSKEKVTFEYFENCPIYKIGPTHQDFKDFVYCLSGIIFDKFYSFAKKNFREKLPLLISGGCGLNCDWNTKWVESGLFSDVFIPPVTNDSGQGIGLAVDAQHYFTGNAKIKWSVYSGEKFVYD
jgi:predicted NodU family carbamoyl transferase